MDLLDGFSPQSARNRRPGGGALVPSRLWPQPRWPGPLRLAGWPRPDWWRSRHPANGGGFHFDTRLPVNRVLLEPYAIATVGAQTAITPTFNRPMAATSRPELWLSERLGGRAGWGLAGAPLLAWQRACSGWEWEFSLAAAAPLHPRLLAISAGSKADAYGPLPVPAASGAPSGKARCLCREPPGRGQMAVASGSQKWMGCSGQVDGQSLHAYRASRLSWRRAWANTRQVFMSSQMVLRAASFPDARPQHRAPPTRNFFPPGNRWMASGLRPG